MLNNKKFDEKIRKYKKIFIYPRNNNFKRKDNISTYKINQNQKLKNNLNSIILDNNDIIQKNKSFLNFFNSRASSYHYLKSKNKINFEYYNLDSFQRNKTCKKNYNIFCKNINNSNIFDKYEELLEEIKYMKQNNKSININININNDFKIQNKKKSKSISKHSTLSSKKNLYDNNDINKNLLNDQEKINEIKDLFFNYYINEKNYSNEKYSSNRIKFHLKKNKSNEYISINNNKKIKILNKIYINNKNNNNSNNNSNNNNINNNKKILKKENIKKNTQRLKLKINKINNMIKEKRNKSISKIINISSNNNENNNNTSSNNHIKYKANTEEKKHKDYYKNIKDDILTNSILNDNKINNTLNNNNDDYYNQKENNKKTLENNYIIKERHLNKENKCNNINLDISLFNEETDNQIQNWINKEKKSKELPKEKNNKNTFFFDNINRKFHNYQISNKYFNNNEFMINNKINNKPVKSINLGDYFDLELSRFNNKLNNYNNIKKITNITHSRHIFKPIY